MAEQKLMEVEIVTPQNVVFSGLAQSVSVPGEKSPFQALYNHASIVSSLETGITKIVDEKGKALFFATSAGFAEINKNKVAVLVDKAFDSSALRIELVEKEISAAAKAVEESTDADSKNAALKTLSEAENKLKAVKKSLER